jgi:hypothetical protein
VKPKDELDLTEDGQFVEFKTSNNNSPRTFQNFKYPNWWMQAFLVTIKDQTFLLFKYLITIVFSGTCPTCYCGI